MLGSSDILQISAKLMAAGAEELEG